MKKFVYSTDDSSTFSTFQIDDVDGLFRYPSRMVSSAKRFISDIEERRRFSDEIFYFINEAYDDLGGFKSFKDMDRFVNDSYLWYITYDGPQPASESELDIDRVLVVSVYRKKFGLKMVGIASRNVATGRSSRMENEGIRIHARSAVNSHIRFMAKRGWAEVSDKLERRCKEILGHEWVINPQYLADNNVFSEMEIDPLDDHYYRPLRKNGPVVRKIAYGTIKI